MVLTEHIKTRHTTPVSFEFRTFLYIFTVDRLPLKQISMDSTQKFAKCNDEKVNNLQTFYYQNCQ